jgi:predicted alpha/beta hydrolase family esterase
MKQALILHGTDAAPDQNWFPWLKAKLEARGYEVWVPLLPQNHTPNGKTYGDFLFGSDFDFADSVVIGHSSGAVEVLNLLNDERLPHVKMAVMVGAWEHGTPPGMEASQFAHLFPTEGYNYEAMKAKADKIAFMHGSDDPYCPLEQAEFLAKQLDAPLTVVPNGHHLGAKYSELPELWSIIEPNL